MIFIYNKDSFENSVEVDNYPWGFRLKTKRRYWVETTNHGDRFCYATLNPKTNTWCKPKKSTYNAIVILVDDDGYITSYSLSKNANKDDITRVLAKLDYNKLSKEQKAQICLLKSINHVMSNVTWTVQKTSEYNLSDPADLARMKADANSPETKAKEAEQAQVKDQINRSINLVYKTCLLKNNLI